MVFWEITLGTAYFLGLRRTYRLALKIQRRIVSPKHPKIRQFLHLRTRKIFDVAISVHKNIQERDIEVGRNLGNWILRWLDRMKPAAQIRTRPELPHNSNSNLDKAKRLTELSRPKTHMNTTQKPQNRESDRHLFSSLKHFRHKPFPPRPNGTTTQYRHYSGGLAGSLIQPSYLTSGRFDGVIRKDILQWIAQR
ncbi:hypothetical protein ISN45_Aa01g024450 [Arabidopsis thaliana x Arabidopsis arenosa]|uniref:Uncharacterized protein n=1 Tax=Arabidopsis thaliana x Arabidopsis arenosa TaxID=1240361 RepID=A0A8T2C975_9BRAS|nr:hypothetical protein ISN45_Aa01g024450 [Arabidopsis thaliana x Arabidopsis arenosa]